MSDEMKAKILEKVKPFVKREIDELIRVFKEGDTLVPRLLRFHLMTEYQLERIIAGRMARGDRILDDGPFSYYQKLLVVSALDVISDEVVASLRKLNSLRNKCAHQRDIQISISDIETIGRPLGKDFAVLRTKYGDDLEGLSLGTFADIYSKLITETTSIDFLASVEKSGLEEQNNDA